MHSESLEVTLDGRTYRFDGARWYDAKSFEVPRPQILVKLNAHAADAFSKSDEQISDLDQLLSAARIARQIEQPSRALRLVKRAFFNAPDDSRVVALYSSILRDAGRSEDALALTANFRRPNAAIFTSRAAALCDLDRWEEAKYVVGRALAIGPSPEAFNVARRIKAARADLYEE